jgi:LacI family transcriptional regulator
MGNSRRLTVREIARIAGVSVATVSRVSNGTGQVSEDMRRRVLDAIERHGYRPDHRGRALAARRHGAVGLVFPGLSGPYFGELIQGFESEAVQSGTSVHILCTHLRRDADSQVAEMSRRVDGLAVLGGTVSDRTLIELAQSLPVVVMAGTGPASIPSVRVENRAAVTALTRHLLVDHGLRRLAFVGSPDGSPDISERWEGFRAAHRDAGIAPPRTPVRVGMQQQDGVLAADQLLRKSKAPKGPGSSAPAGSPGVDAIVCANDETALGVLVGALGRGIRVPEDLAITGFDDAPMAPLVTPPLTTIRQPIRELAAETARQLLEAAGDGGTAAMASVVLPTEVVLRGSCGCT